MTALRLIIFIGLCFSFNTARSEIITFAYLLDGLNEVQKNENQVGLRIWAEEIAKQGNDEIRIRIVKKFPEMISLIKKKQVNYVMLNTVHYLEHENDLKPLLDHRILALKRSKTLFEQYFVITQEKFIGNQLNNLKGKSLSVSSDNLLMNFYLEYLLLEAGNKPSKRFFKSIKDTKTASQAVLDVYFNKSMACIVPKHILDMTAELNPAILTRIKTLHQSDRIFIPVLIVTVADNPEAMNQTIFDSILNIKSTPRGRQIIDLFKIDSVVEIEHEKLDAMKGIFHQFKRYRVASK